VAGENQVNRTMKFAAAFALACTALTSTAAFAEKPVELAPTQLAAAQSHTYAVPSSAAFSASIAALQTLGYVDITASKDAGTISAITESKGKIIYNILWGVGKKKLTQKASILVEELGPGQALVRLNLLVSETKQRGLWAASFTDGKIVKIAEPYSTFFTALDAEVARRSPAPVPATAIQTPVAPAQDAAAPAGN
jgi:hypothetical protein